MTTRVATYLGRKMLSKEMDKHKSKKAEGRYDPYYEEIPHPRNPKKTKKVKKQIPAYIPPKDADVLAAARRRAYKLDYCLFNLLGFRFGWSSVIGLAPVVGDCADVGLSMLLVKKMWGIEGHLPTWTLIMMLFNIGIDFLVGLVPILGDLADASLKANGRNVRLFEEYLDKKYKPKEIPDFNEEEYERDIRDGRTPRRPRPATVYEDFDEEDLERFKALGNEQQEILQPQRAYSGRRDRIPDEELGLPRHDTHRSHREKPSRNATKSSRRK